VTLKRIRIAELVRGFIATGVLAGIASGAAAQTFPSRPITFIYPYAASATEANFRLIFQEATKTLGQPIIIQMQPGAGGKIGFEAMMRAPKDGYTVAFANTPLAVNLALLDAAFKIEPDRDYAPITLAFDVPLVLMASASLPFRDLKGMVEYGKANPNKLNFGLAGGRGTTGHLLVELFNLRTGMAGVPVAYKGEGPALTDLLGGQVQALFGSVPAGKPHFDSGKLVAIAVTSEQRTALLPSVPTLKETGVIDVAQATTAGIAGPAGLPANLVATLNKAFTAAVQSPDVRKRIEDSGMIPRGASGEVLGQTIRADLKRWGEIVRVAKISID
jgi:tripartite-type tricarboxylate transporter receptor subunit TctC